MNAATHVTFTETEPSSRASCASTPHTPTTPTPSRCRVPVKDGNPLPLTDTEGVDVEAVRCPYCNLPMFVERTTRHCTHCDWRHCPACARWYSLKKAPVHETEE